MTENFPPESPNLPDEPDVLPAEEDVKPARAARRRSWTPLYLLIPVAFVLGLGAGYVMWGRSLSKVQQELTALQTQVAQQGDTQQGGAQEQQQAKFRRYDVPIADNPAQGPENAAITIIEFSDYECPFCKRWHDEVLPQILKNYPDKVRFVYRDFPLSSIHSNATSAAEAANCANDQDAYWAFQGKLFSDGGLGIEAYQKYADELKLNTTEFNKCLSERKYRDEVKADFDYAANLGVSSTPTFFLNGIPIVGAQPYEVFQQVIEKELAGEIPK